MTFRFTGAANLSDDDASVAIRERLAALYGEAATLTLGRREGGRTQVRLEFPFEPPAATAGTRVSSDAKSKSAIRRDAPA